MRDGFFKGDGPKKVEYPPETIRRMFRLRDDGQSDAAIARGFGISPQKLATLIGKGVRR